MNSERTEAIDKVIQKKLQTIENEEQVEILFAIESGSRAWGFESPDSDYDVRFIYVRKETEYLRLDSVRDVIEWQLDDVLDVNGWDLQKALRLLYKSNPVFFEWLYSPIVYRTSEQHVRLQELSKEYFSRTKLFYHYWHMANNNYRETLRGNEVKLKKYFYVLRPIWAAQWITEIGTVPPVLFSALKNQCCPPSLNKIIDSLLQQKIDTPEKDTIPCILELNQYIEVQLKSMENKVARFEQTSNYSWDSLNQFFYQQLKE